MTRALGPFPITPLGLLVGLGCGYALVEYGFGRIDLVLLVIGAVGLGVAAFGLLATTAGALILWLHHRKRGQAKDASEGSLDVECGYPVPTGFWLPRLRALPFVSISWRWITPEAQVRIAPKRGRLREEVIASRRGQVAVVVRELEVGDIFGLTQICLRLTERRKVRFVPSVGQLKRVDVIRGMAGGEDISHPEGPQEGELYDLRAYTPGDPIRFVLWKVFARTRQLVVRAPERALSPIRQTCAYVVAGSGDEPAAGAARLAVELGALGSEWVLGADGSNDDATRKDQAVDVLARSADVADPVGGKGLGAFLQRRGKGSIGRAVVFVPGRPGPWLDNVAEQCKHVGSRGGRIEFVVGTDGIIPPPKRKWLARLAIREHAPEIPPGSTAPVTTQQVAEVVRVLSNAGRVIVVDRAAGRMFAGGHLHALDKQRAA
ncbi:hypothetical protein ENSA5_06390 [Enhygromyxa salina]|uniref:Uncharacterized protein n=2 Tax=Enhygromyxa salina TaxID=215803 RepID=A0A2S9YHQ2_9BACT|nr:hypothetical protein ENSA5_06390 [Enhygromyxa salina]